MNQFNVLDIADSLEDLEKDFIDWQMLPYDFRVRSDSECIKQYGMTNVQLYNTQRANFIYYSDTPIQEAVIRLTNDEGDLISKNINDLPNGCTSSGTINVRADKILMTKHINLEDDDIVLIPDWLNPKVPDYSHDELLKLYNDYLLANPDHKLIADSHSLKIWHKTVPDMYVYMRSKFHSFEDSQNAGDPIPVEESAEFTPDLKDQALLNYRDTIAMESTDDLSLMIRKLDCYSKHNVSLYESKVLESYGDKIRIGTKTYRADIPGVVPFLQYDEYANNPNGLDTRKVVGGMFPYILSYDEKPKQRYQDLKDAWNNNDKDKLLEMGWNPYVKPTPESVEYAREKWIKFLNEHYPVSIYDLSLYDTNLSTDALNEAVDNLPSSKSLKPVFLVLNTKKSPTVFSKVSNKIFSENEYSHIGVAFSSTLTEIYTFEEIRVGVVNRMRIDSITDYKYDTDKIRVIVFFVRPDIFKKFKDSMKLFTQTQDNSMYAFDNTMSLVADKPNLKNRSLAFVCASFMDSMFKIANVYDQFAGMKNKNATVHFYILYTGRASDYKSTKIDKKIKVLQKNKDFNQLSFFEPDLVMGEIQYKLIENFNITTSDDRMNIILKEIREMLTPNDAADNYILENIDMIKQALQDSHYLLSTYGDNDIEGIKREYLKVFYYRDILDKYRKTIINTPEESEINQLLNMAQVDLDLYGKTIKILEPDWDVWEAIANSDFSDKVVIIDGNKFKFDGSKCKDISLK